MSEWISFERRVVGGNLTPIAFETYLGDNYFSTRKEAIKHGFEECGSDDFNVAKFVNGKCVAIYWMSKNLNEPQEVLEELTELRNA